MPKRQSVKQIQHGFLLRMSSQKDLEERQYPPSVDLPTLGDSQDFGRLYRARNHDVRVVRTTEDALEALAAARSYPGGLHLRGAGHSMNGQTLPIRGLQLVLRFEDADNELRLDDPLSVIVPGSSSWENALVDLEHRGRTIGVLTDHPETTVGGTLSVSGFGPASLRFGRQVDMVDSLQVILADGRILWCNSDTHSTIFRATLAGLGGIGIIRKALLKTTDYFPYVVTVVRVASRWRDMIDHSDWLAKNIQSIPPNLCQHHYGMGSTIGPNPPNFASTYTFEFHSLEEALKFAKGGVHDVPVIGQTWSFLRVESRANSRLRFRSEINALLQQRWGDTPDSVFQLWQDFVFPDVGLSHQFILQIEPDLASPIIRETNFARYGCLIKEIPSTPHIPLSFYAPGTTEANSYHASQGFYFAVPRNRPQYLEQVKRFLRHATNVTFELGGRPYLYGWNEMDGADMESKYGASWEFFTSVKRSVDPDCILNRGLFTRLGIGA